MFLSNNEITLQFLSSILITYLTLRFVNNNISSVNSYNRFVELDGLRGMLACFVFQHHAFIWYFLVHNRRWSLPPNLFVKNLGQVSVVCFFMVSGFLFIHKIRTSSTPFDWVKFYKSRFKRLIPLNTTAVLLMFLIIIVDSDGILRQPFFEFVNSLFHWLTFNLFTNKNHHDINYFKNTNILLAGVTWTLKYEWFFYISLPFISFLMHKKTSLIWVFVGVLGIFFMYLHAFEQKRLFLLAAFFLGGVTTLLVDIKRLNEFCKSRVASLGILIGVSLIYLNLTSAFSLYGVMLIFPIFIIIVCGCDLFGLLLHPYVRKLGQISYSIYLLHGLILSICFYLIIGINNLRKFSVLEYSLIVSFQSAILVILSSIFYRHIERRFAKIR